MKEINHECYVSLEVAKLLKEAGFDWDTYSAYNKDGVFADKNRSITLWNHFADYYSAPTLDVAQRWLREVKGRLVLVGSVPEYFFCTIYEYKRKIDHIFIESDSPFDTYEEAQEAGIKKALELILKKGK